MRERMMQTTSADVPTREGISLPVSLLVIVVGALMLLWPAIYNGFPFLFYDTEEYLTGGQKALEAVGLGTEQAQVEVQVQVQPRDDSASGVAAEEMARAEPSARDDRSVYYGLFAQLLNLLGGIPAVVAMQAILTATCLARALHWLGVRSAITQLAILAAVAAFTPLSFFVSLVMPDIFGALMLLGFAIVAVFHQRLRWPETTLWLGIILAGVLFHKAFLAMAVATALAALVFRLMTPPVTAAIPRIAAPLVLGVLGTVIVGAAVERVLDRPVVHTPFLLARLVEDRTAEAVLREDCPQAGYRTCIYVPELPMSENEFLWGNTTRGVRREASGGFMGLALEDRLAIGAEQRLLVMEVLRRYPLEQLARSTENFARALVTVHLRRFQPPDKAEKELASKKVFYNISLRALPEAMPKFAESKLWKGQFPLGLISLVSAVTYLPSLALLGVLIALHLRKSSGVDNEAETLFFRLAAVVLLGLLVNAAISGIISGVSGRYQARFAWLPPFLMLTLIARSRGWVR